MDSNDSVGATLTLSPAVPATISPPARVVLLDDDDIIADTLGRALPRTGLWDWRGWAGSYAEFRDLVLRHNPQLALIDLDLRIESGFDAIERISREFPGLRSVVLSGFRRADYIGRALSAGARGYIDKDESLSSIHELLLRAVRGETVLSTRAIRTYQDSPPGAPGTPSRDPRDESLDRLAPPSTGPRQSNADLGVDASARHVLP